MFKKTGETKVFKKPSRGFSKKAEEQKPEEYGVDDLCDDADKGFNPYENPSSDKPEDEDKIRS
tara:strand:- start:501 stop:689 length:189 start_codon:yes stop_codon:yes gene_type:complete